MSSPLLQDFVLKKKDYLMSQVGNPEGADKPNKKVRVCTVGAALCTKLMATLFAFSSTILVCGCVKVKRRCPLVSRRPAKILAMSIVCNFFPQPKEWRDAFRNEIRCTNLEVC